jgi:phospho-N-acetylmuramoyl-pentapeptide-transferase
VITVLLGGALAFVFALFGTRLAIAILVKRGYGQFIRDDGPTTHHVKRGTPTMGGAAIIVAAVLAYAFSHLLSGRAPTMSGILVLGLATGTGAVGFADDWLKVSHQRSLGLRTLPKLALQTLVAVVFAALALMHTGGSVAVASRAVSVVRDVGPTLPWVVALIWICLLVAASSNAVNLTDGLDGLAAGAAAMLFGAFVFIGSWQANHDCGHLAAGEGLCYPARNPTDLAGVAAVFVGACLGFLWWNAHPAKIIMGDTGSLGLGGAIAGLAITTRTELLLVILGGLFVAITVSVILQVGWFKLSGGKRLFRMAPLHHHFELKGWAEITITIRFWLVAAIGAGAGLGVFYADWVAHS